MVGHGQLQGRLSFKMVAILLDRMDADEVLMMGDGGDHAEGECVECGEEAVWTDPIYGDEYCSEHAKEHFTERHD